MNECGNCPKCGISGNLNYGTGFLQDFSYGYPVECPDCGFIGIEWYDVNFAYYTDDNGDKIEYKHFTEQQMQENYKNYIESRIDPQTFSEIDPLLTFEQFAESLEADAE